MEEENTVNYHLLTASLKYYENCNFDELLQDYNKYKPYIYWSISRTDGKYIRPIKKNDICFIYYSNLPDESSRILFVAKVLESDYGKKDKTKSICPDATDKELCIKVKLQCISLKDKEKFSLNRLRNTYQIISGKGRIGYQKIDPHIKNHKELISAIEEEMKNGTQTLPTVNQYFNDKYCLCEFQGKDSQRKNHDTFIEKNGFYYIERHHLVTRSLIKKYNTKISNIDKIIDNEKNLFKLCPNCHMEIHHGKLERRKEKIKMLYEKNKSYFDSNFNEIKGTKNTLEWLYDIYNCN